MAHTAKDTLEITDWGVRRAFVLDGEEKLEAVAWSDLQRVEIMTTAGGPWNEDFFFILKGEEGGVLISNALAVEASLVAALQARLPDLDNEAIIDAAGSTELKTFRIWERATLH